MSHQTTQFGDSIIVSESRGVATVTMDRGDGRNAMSRQLMRDLIDTANWLHGETGIQVVVLTGKGAFSAGADLKDPERVHDSSLTRLELRQMLRLGPDMCAAWERLEQITICAVEGFCIGGGVALAVACDHRIAAQSSHFRLPEIPLGMNMSWQTNPRMVALVGPSRAKFFTILGEKLPARTAMDWGLVDLVVPKGDAMAAAIELAERYAALPPIAVRMTKQAINVSAQPLGHATSFMDRDQFAYAATTNDQREAVHAFLEKRRPTFKGD